MKDIVFECCRICAVCIVIVCSVPAPGFTQGFSTENGGSSEKLKKTRLGAIDRGGVVQGMRFNGKGTELATWTTHEIVVFDLDAKKRLFALRKPRTRIVDVVCDARETWRAAGIRGDTFCLDNLTAKSHTALWTGVTAQPDCAAFSTDGTRLILVGSDRRSDAREGSTHVRVFKTRASELTLEHVYPRLGATAVGLHPCKQVAAIAWEHELVFVDLKTGRSVARAARQRAAIRKIAFAPSGDTVAVLLGMERTYLGRVAGIKHVFEHNDAHADLRVHLVESKSGEEISTLGGNSYPVSSVAFLPQSRIALTAGGTRRVRAWHVRTGSVQERADDLGGDFDVQVVGSPDGRLFAVAGFDNTIWLFASTDPK